MTQDWNDQDYKKHASFVSELGNEVIALLKPEAGEHVLDLGCGEGTLALQLQQMGCIVKGVDFSENMVSSAQAHGVEAEVIDGQRLPFNQQFDAVFSNAALHWMPDQQAVFNGAYNALKPSGRFVVEMGGAGNITSVVNALAQGIPYFGGVFNNPWTFPTVDETVARLETSGFCVSSIQLFDRPTHIPTDVRGWLTTFTGGMIETVAEEKKEDLLEYLYDTLASKLSNEQGQWILDYRRLRFCALKGE